MLIPTRNFQSPEYRYGFQGQEKDDEIKGNGNSLNYKFRMHDPRVGRFFAVDPLEKVYPHNSPYAFSENRVIDGAELEGLEYITRIHIVVENKVKYTYDMVYYKMSNEVIEKIGGTTTSWYNAAPYGPEGKGVKHEFRDKKGKVLYKAIWDHQRTHDIRTHGLYSGPGSITTNGPEFENTGKNVYGLETTYDFNWDPIDQSDGIAKKHDVNYFVKAPTNYWGYIDDTRTLNADNIMIAEVKALLDSNPDVATETNVSSKSQLAFIGILAHYKTWKVGKLKEMDLDPSNPDEFMQVTILNKNDRADYINDHINQNDISGSYNAIMKKVYILELAYPEKPKKKYKNSQNNNGGQKK